MMLTIDPGQTARDSSNDFGRWLLAHADSRVLVAIALTAMALLLFRRRGFETKATLEDMMKILISVQSLWTSLVIGCVLALMDPIDISMIPTDTLRLIGLNAVVLSFVFGWRAMEDVFRDTDGRKRQRRRRQFKGSSTECRVLHR